MGRTSRNLPALLLAAAVVCAVATTLVLTRDLTFFGDSWEFLMNRRSFSADSILKPHNEHIVVIPVLIQLLMLHLFGMDTVQPEFVLLALFLAATACLLFVYVSRRLGPWLGLFAAVLILFLGPAWELLLWPFEISLIGSVLFGLAMLLALEREDRRGDVVACACLAASLGFSTLGIPFVVAALVIVLQSPRQRWRSRAFVVAVPVVLYALWYLGWGNEAESHVTFRNILASPRYVAEAMAIGTGNLFGLGTSPVDGIVEKIWGAALLVGIVLAIAYRQVRKPGFDPRLWPVAAAAAANWFLSGFNLMPGRDPSSSRYQYASAVFILLLLANLFAGARTTVRTLALGAAVTVLAIAPNLVVLENGSNFFKEQAVFTRADTGALEIAKQTVTPEFRLEPDIAGTGSLIDISAVEYFEAIDEFGSPAYTPSELEAAPPHGRRQADIILAQALPLSTEVQLGVYDGAGGGENCLTVTDGQPEEVRIDPGRTRIEVPPGPAAEFSLRRFAQEGEFPATTAGADGESTTILSVPRDEAPRYPWHLHVEATQPVRVCR
jgi:hypothetical protein